MRLSKVSVNPAIDNNIFESVFKVKPNNLEVLGDDMNRQVHILHWFVEKNCQLYILYPMIY